MRALRSKNELAMAQSNLNSMMEEIVFQKAQLDQEKREVALQIKELKKLIKQNEQIVKRDETVLFAIKEATINTIKDYEKMQTILNNLLLKEPNVDQIVGLLTGCGNKIYNLENFFYNSFGKTTDVYLEESKKVIGLN